MAEVNLIIDGRTYGVACDDGQERRVQQLGGYIDQRLREIANGSGTSNKAQLMILTALLLADEVFDLRDNLTKAANTNNEPVQYIQQEPETIVYEGLTSEDEEGVTSAIGKLAARIENLARRVQKA